MRSDSGTHSYNEIRHWATLLLHDQRLEHTPVIRPDTDSGTHSYNEIRHWDTLLLYDQKLAGSSAMRSDSGTHSYYEIRHWYMFFL